ncbi:MAG: histidine kinase [Rhodospirillales bacterium]|nr:histidine kinase [Rhodospirillales bacterium]
MTHFLVSETNPDGSKLEDILRVIRSDIFDRCTKIRDDMRPEAQIVLGNNVKILDLISQAITLAEDSSHVLDKAFGPSAKGGLPRIGDA